MNGCRVLALCSIICFIIIGSTTRPIITILPKTSIDCRITERKLIRIAKNYFSVSHYDGNVVCNFTLVEYICFMISVKLHDITLPNGVEKCDL